MTVTATSGAANVHTPFGAQSPRVVAIGGGSGLSALLRGLKRLTPHLTAIVTVADDGGSSGRLRAELGVLPPGDIRNCLVALADDESLLSALFSYRFKAGALAGHSFGNLFLAALTEVTGDFDRAIKESSKVLAIRGTVLPSTTSDVRLHALLSDGRHLVGESLIGRSPVSVQRVWLEPEGAVALPLALERIAQADIVVLGPGSLFTSVVPNLLAGGLIEALAAADAPIVYVANVMTQPGETAAFSGPDHLRALIGHLGRGVLDAVLVNSTPVPTGLLERYDEEGAEPLRWPEPTGAAAASAEASSAAVGDVRNPPADVERIEGVPVIRRDLLHITDHARHDPDILAACLASMARVRRQ
ncbi:MAG: uridine diphosphate-N-acetylglucosamine-binding protein YvcK [Actinobacteria bacterium]|nr:uridine diphosphate-N-acetylglucosamine-binding protein YvcK [Actinomycetota bacterium]